MLCSALSEATAILSISFFFNAFTITHFMMQYQRNNVARGSYKLHDSGTRVCASLFE